MHVLGFTNMRVREMREPFDAMGEAGSLVTVDASDGIRGYVAAFRTGARRIEERDTDAILLYNGSGLLGVVCSVLSRRYDVPLLIRVNGDLVRQHREQAVEHLRKREWYSLATHVGFALLTELTTREADGFVPVSEALVEVLRRRTDRSAAQFAAVPSPIRVGEYDPGDYDPDESRRPAYRTTDGPLLLTVTNLNFRGKYEGAAKLVDALVPVLRRRPELEYVIAGDGRHAADLERAIDSRVGEPSIRERIHTPGFVEDIANLYAAADVFVYASSIDGYPNVIIEAQAAELPIITNPAYGISEQIDDGTSGVFAEPDGALTDALTELLDDDDERRRLGRNARRRVEAENDPAAVGRALLAAVRRLVASGPTDAERADERSAATTGRATANSRSGAGVVDAQVQRGNGDRS